MKIELRDDLVKAIADFEMSKTDTVGDREIARLLMLAVDYRKLGIEHDHHPGARPTYAEQLYPVITEVFRR